VGGKRKEEVHVGKAPFLEFNGMNIPESGAENVVFNKFIDQRCLVHVKHTDCEVWTIGS